MMAAVSSSSPGMTRCRTSTPRTARPSSSARAIASGNPDPILPGIRRTATLVVLEPDAGVVTATESTLTPGRAYALDVADAGQLDLVEGARSRLRVGPRPLRRLVSVGLKHLVAAEGIHRAKGGDRGDDRLACIPDPVAVEVEGEDIAAPDT